MRVVSKEDQVLSKITPGWLLMQGFEFRPKIRTHVYIYNLFMLLSSEGGEYLVGPRSIYFSIIYIYNV